MWNTQGAVVKLTLWVIVPRRLGRTQLKMAVSWNSGSRKLRQISVRISPTVKKIVTEYTGAMAKIAFRLFLTTLVGSINCCTNFNSICVFYRSCTMNFHLLYNRLHWVVKKRHLINDILTNTIRMKEQAYKEKTVEIDLLRI